MGKLIAEAFVNFVETEQEPLISFDDVLEAVHKPGAIMSLQERVNGEVLLASMFLRKNMLYRLNRNSNAEEVSLFY